MKKLFTMCMMLCCVMAVMAQSFNVTTDEGYELKYKVLDAVEQTVECQGLEGFSGWNNGGGGEADLVMPEKVSYDGVDYAVTSIGSSAFSYCFGFTGSLMIPDGVTSIGFSAFSRCSGFTGSLTIPDGVTSIGSSAFNGCSGFTGSLTIGDGVKSIEDWAFVGCSGLTNLEVAEGNMQYAASDMMLFSKDMTTLVMCLCGKQGELTIPAGVTSIGDIAFSCCDSLTGSLTIGDGVKSIGENAFEGCSGFTNLEVAESNTQYAASDMMLFSKDMTTLVMCICGKQGELVIPDGVTSIGSSAFSYCFGLTGSLTIPDGVESIGERAFVGCSSFTGDLTIGDGVESIGSSAFWGCSGFIGSLTIGDGVESIGASTFLGCSGFTGSLTIPDGVESIGNYAFYGCDGFTSVTNKALVPQGIDSNVFEGVAIGSIPLYVPEESISLYEDAAVWKNFKSIEALHDTALEDVVQEMPFVQQGHILTFAQPVFLNIFTVSGQLVRSGIMEQCVLPEECGVYVVQAAKGSFKVMVND